MLGHHHIAYDLKAVLASHLLQDAQKYIAGVVRAKQRLPPITAACDEVKIAKAIDSLQPAGHGAAL